MLQLYGVYILILFQKSWNEPKHYQEVNNTKTS